MSHCRRQPAFEPLGGALDLALAGQEGEHAAGLRRQRLADRLGHRVLDRRRRPAARHSGSRPESCGPALSITGAPPSSLATRAPSSVADMTSSRGRAAARPARRAPAPARNRRRASARGTRRTGSAATPGSSGSSRIMRASMPSVTTRMRVFADMPAFHAHGVADRSARLLAEQRGHAAGGGAGGEPARLEQQDACRRRARARRAAPAAPASSCRRRAARPAPRCGRLPAPARAAGRISVTGRVGSGAM